MIGGWWSTKNISSDIRAYGSVVSLWMATGDGTGCVCLNGSTIYMSSVYSSCVIHVVYAKSEIWR